MKSSTFVALDFTGDELVKIGEACIASGLTLGEFIDRAIADLVHEYKYGYKKETNGL